MPLSKPKSRPNKDVKPKRLDDTHGRQADVKYPLDLISLNGPSKTTTTARFKITKSKKETVRPRKPENVTSYQKKNTMPPEPLSSASMSRPPSPGCGALPDCWSCSAELCEYPPCSCEECGMPN
ncbi:hypothetical protein McanMca71_007973 [Microsporum canis]